MNHSAETHNFGYNTTLNFSCSECMDKCDEDMVCDGVECGSNHCRLLTNNTCNKTQLIPKPSKSKETCFKAIPFQCKVTNYKSINTYRTH